MRNNLQKKLSLFVLALLCGMTIYAFNPKIERLGNFDNAECYMVDDTLLVLPHDLSKFQCGIFTDPPKDRYELMRYYNLRGYSLIVGYPYGIETENDIEMFRLERIDEGTYGSGRDTLLYTNSELINCSDNTVEMKLLYGSFDYKDNYYNNTSCNKIIEDENIGGFTIGESKAEVCEYLGVPKDLEFTSVAILTSPRLFVQFMHDVYKPLLKDDTKRDIINHNGFERIDIIVLTFNEEQEIKRIQISGLNSGKYINNTDRKWLKEEYIGIDCCTELWIERAKKGKHED